jgi:hypothetical protein
MPGARSRGRNEPYPLRVLEALIGTSLPATPRTYVSGIDRAVLTSVYDRISIWHLSGDVTLI